MTPMRLEAPAKLNLSLRVVGRRDDGYHQLESVLVLLELADQLLLMPGSSGLRIEGATRDVPLGNDNLAWRGLVSGLAGDAELACLALDKRIPSAAGLGGGSSDAAAAWRLGRAWTGQTRDATPDEIAGLANIGADVPFFASATPAARVTGIGERVQPLPADAAEVVLVHPPFALSTADVFAELRREEWGTQTNDLLAPARRLRPELDAVLAAVERAGGSPRLTGSGPTVFAATDDPERADTVASRLSAAGVIVKRTRTRTTPPVIETIDRGAEPTDDLEEELP